MPGARVRREAHGYQRDRESSSSTRFSTVVFFIALTFTLLNMYLSFHNASESHVDSGVASMHKSASLSKSMSSFKEKLQTPTLNMKSEQLTPRPYIDAISPAAPAEPIRTIPLAPPIEPVTRNAKGPEEKHITQSKTDQKSKQLLEKINLKEKKAKKKKNTVVEAVTKNKKQPSSGKSADNSEDTYYSYDFEEEVSYESEEGEGEGIADTGAGAGGGTGTGTRGGQLAERSLVVPAMPAEKHGIAGKNEHTAGNNLRGSQRVVVREGEGGECVHVCECVTALCACV